VPGASDRRDKRNNRNVEKTNLRKRLVDRHGPLNGDFLLTRLHYRVSTVHAVVRG
jgi:hypothetical protein